MKLAACWRYESSFSKFIWPVLTDGVCFSWCSLKCHRDLPEFEVEFEIDDDIILPPKAVATFKLEFNWFLGKLDALQSFSWCLTENKQNVFQNATWISTIFHFFYTIFLIVFMSKYHLLNTTELWTISNSTDRSNSTFTDIFLLFNFRVQEKSKMFFWLHCGWKVFLVQILHFNDKFFLKKPNFCFSGTLLFHRNC